jgi:hypothetical protein
MKTPKKKSLLKEGEFMHDLVGEITELRTHVMLSVLSKTGELLNV